MTRGQTIKRRENVRQMGSQFTGPAELREVNHLKLSVKNVKIYSEQDLKNTNQTINGFA
jgi:hypothetical protein